MRIEVARALHCQGCGGYFDVVKKCLYCEGLHDGRHLVSPTMKGASCDLLREEGGGDQ